MILGASGFIGRNAVRYFKNQGHEITAVIRQGKDIPDFGVKVDIRFADLTNKESVYKTITGDHDVILQLAASTTNMKDVIERPYVHVTDNAVMNAWIFQAAHEAGIKHVFFTSCTTMYAGTGNSFQQEEDDFTRDEIHPKYFGVASTKVYIEDMAKFWSTLGKTKYTVLRHSNIFGPHDRFNLKTGHVCGATIRKVIDATDKVTVWGAGTEIRDLLPVESLMEAMDLALDQEEAYKLYNIGSGVGLSINDIVETVIAISGKKLTIEHDKAAPTMKFDLILNCKKAVNELEWKQPKLVDIIIALTRTYQWAVKNA